MGIDHEPGKIKGTLRKIIMDFPLLPCSLFHTGKGFFMEFCKNYQRIWGNPSTRNGNVLQKKSLGKNTRAVANL